jgi:amino acid adenylation domain-containing protein
MRVLVSTAKGAEEALIDGRNNIRSFCIDGAGQGLGWNDLFSFSDAPLEGVKIGDDDLAYILYTSGSTGKPKGVCISNRNALAFIDWATEELNATSTDRFSNHAPFHFDLSVLDLYSAFRAGAAVCLIPDGMSYVPKKLVSFILREKITIWYSVPSVLILMMEQGGLLDLQDLPFRAILFAGEPFPIKHLRRLYEHWSELRFLNLYGPTETNVCTFYELEGTELNRLKPVPIGRACSGDRVWAVKSDGMEAKPGEEGELMVSGPTVMLGYWGKTPHNGKPYATGDLVRLEENGNYEYLGRRDHMVKVRGHRVELGDIEAALAEHPKLDDVVVVVADSGMDARLIAFVKSTGNGKPTLLDVKRHCAERLPRYMIVDDVSFLNEIPRTRNGKIDRLRLTRDAIESKNRGGF